MPLTNVITAPDRGKMSRNNKVFLGGSIEMGTATDWRGTIVKAFPVDVTFLDPYRKDWDKSWEQKLNNPKFYEQVNWELNMLDIANVIVMYFEPETMSPISLLELGLYATSTNTVSNKVLVCCPEGFWRKGNVDIVCQRYNIPVYENLETLIVALRSALYFPTGYTDEGWAKA